jgi:16S rRNA (guanine527-N7)-methyltransferase
MLHTNFITDKQQVIASLQQILTLTNQQENALEDYVKAIIKENNNFNFIGKSTINNIWHRHILDCAQILPLIDCKKRIADFGSGCGLPGLVLSILGAKEMHLIEKSFRKSEFLKKYRCLSPNKVIVHQNMLEQINNFCFDIIVSRALASLPKLFTYVEKFLIPNGCCVFLKGKSLQQEIQLAKQEFSFDYKLISSITSQESNIICIHNLKRVAKSKSE